jgi:hypothetical protein
MSSKSTAFPDGAAGEADAVPLTEELSRVREALRGLQFGTVTVIVQDSVVVQVDRTEKIRLPRPAHAS